MSKNIIEFCEERGIKWFPIDLEIKEVDGEMKKILHPKVYLVDNDYYIPKMTDFKNLSESKISDRQFYVDKNNYEYIALDTNDICQLDIDSVKAKEHFKDLLKDNPYYLSATKKMPHIFCKINKDKYPKTAKGKCKDRHPYNKDDIDIDILTGQWAYVKKDMIVTNPLLKINDLTDILFGYAKEESKEESKKETKEESKEEISIETEIKKVLKKISKEKKTKIKEIKDEQEKEKEKHKYKKQKDILEKIINVDDNKLKELTEYLNCLNKERFINYDNWMRLTTIIKGHYGEEAYDIYDDYCSKYKGYNKTQNKTYWKTLKSDSISIGTLLHWCKEDNYKLYSEIILKKYDGLTISDKFCCEILSMITDNIIWKNDQLYIYDGQIWKTGNDAINKFKDIIDNDLYDYINLHILTFFIQHKEIQTLIRQLRRIQTQKGKDDVIKTSKQPQFKFNKDDDENIIFNKYWYLFPMKSKVYNLETEKWENYKKDMYITNKLNYDYIEPDENIYKEFQELLNKIFPNENIKKKFLMICSTGLENRLKQKIHIFTGVGGNGKSLLCNYLSSVLQTFYTLGDTQIITYGGKKDDTKIANMSGKRVIMFPEPDKLKKIDVGELKKYTGEDKINARKIYEKNTENINTGTYIICCNSLPLLNEAPDQAVKRRFDITPFISSFTTDKTLIDSNNHIYEADITLEQKGDYYKQSFLKCIIETYKEYKENKYQYMYIDECNNRTKNYYEKSDIINNFFIEQYELTENENNVIQIKSIYDEFRESEIYKLLTKEEKRIYNRTAIIEFIQGNILYKCRYGVNDKNNAILKKIKYKNIEEN